MDKFQKSRICYIKNLNKNLSKHTRTFINKKNKTLKDIQRLNRISKQTHDKTIEYVNSINNTEFRKEMKK